MTTRNTALNAYTRIVAKNYPSFRVNCLCPDLVKTDANTAGILKIDEDAENVVRLVLLPNNSPSSLFFDWNEVSSFV
jgi:(+)-neomenthol dehydrogenase